ncbi:RNA-binding protein [Pseudoflavitalea sp. G-6-1-2]|nr:RNA-binding protein [Pseudoflavitalea sp. G-6-1-2]
MVTMNIYVGNLSWQMTDDDLRTLFEQYGSVTSAKIVKDKASGRSKGFGFVEMPEDSEAQNALTSLYESEVLGRKIIVNEAQPKPQNGGGGGGGFKKRSFGGGSGGGGGYKKGGFNRGGGGGYNRDF